MSDMPSWVVYLQALATPAIAVAGLWIAHSNHKLATQKRQDELFDRRFSLLERVRAFQRHLSDERNGDRLLRGVDDLATEAEFLFGTAFASSLQEILNKTGDMAPFDSDPSVGRLFMSKMKIGAS